MIRYIPAMIINYMEFSNKLRGDLKEFKNELEETRIALKKTSGYIYDNNVARFSNIFGTEFAFSLSEKTKWNNPERKWEGTNVFELSVWDYGGGIAIFNGIIPSENRDKFIQEALSVCEKWSRGQKQCSDCGEWISYIENQSHRYFAGIYCDKCWNGKWKAIEAKETYD